MPQIAAIVATIEPWPAIEPCLKRLFAQAVEVDAEVIVADGTPDGDGLAGTDSFPPGVTILRAAGASVFALRALAAKAASAEFLAFTEDHCVVDETWLARLLASHRAHPEAGMVAGAIANGSSDGFVDWANFLMTFAEFMPPAPPRPLKRVPPMGNCSFRRSLMLGGPLPEGWLEVVLAPTMVQEQRMHYDDRIVVSHVQPRHLRKAMNAHFDNGRACAGLALPHMAARDWWIRLATTPVMAGILYVSVLRSLKGRTIPMRARLSVPLVSLLCASHAAGELVGLIRGEGVSARRLN